MKYERLTTKDKNGNWQVWEDDYSHPFEALQTAIDKLAELEDKIERGELVENTVVAYVNMGRSDSKTLIDKALKYDELKAKIENGTLIELKNRKPLMWGKDGDTVHCQHCGEDLMGVFDCKTEVIQCPKCGDFVDGLVAEDYNEEKLKELKGNERDFI